MAGAQVAWGLDVGTTSLKAIKLARDGEKLKIEAFDVVEHDKFLTEPDIDRDEVIRHTLGKFLERHPVKRDLVFVGVPGSTTFARFVKLPPVEPKKVPEIVRFEAIQQIPFPLDQVNWDYQTFQSADSPDVEVGIFAMKKELVTQVLSNFQQSDMTVHGVQMSPLAVYNAAVYDGMTENKGTVLIDIGAEHTDLIVSDQGRLWMRTINIGGNNFTDALAKSFKQPFSRAEQLKKNAATSKYAKQIFQAMRPIFADLVAEIQRSIGFYNSSHRDSKLERIVGMGSTFRLPQLQKYIQQELKLEVVRLDSFRKATAEGRLAAGLQENILSMSTAYGLALQGLDLAAIDTSLLPMEIARQMLWKEKRPWFIGAAAAIVVGVAAVGMRYYFDSSAWAVSQGQTAAENTRKIGAQTKLNDDFRRGAKSYDNDKAQVESFVKLADHRAVWPTLLADVYSALPQAKDPAKSIVLTSVASEYHGHLNAVDLATVAAGASGGDAPGGSGNTATATPAGTPAGKAPASDRGFVLVITGYSTHPTLGDQMIKDFSKAIKDAAPETGPKPYYLTAGGSTYLKSTFRSSVTSGTSDHSPWGSGSRGSFWNYYVPAMMGQNSTTTAGGLGGALIVAPTTTAEIPVDAYQLPPMSSVSATAPANPAGPPSMNGASMFTLKIKVFVR